MSEIQELITSGSKKKILLGLKMIEKQNAKEYSEEIFNLLVKIFPNDKTWEEQCKIINLLGMFEYKKAQEFIGNICKVEKKEDSVTSRAALCYVRLKRISLNDASAVIQFMKTSSYSIHLGALEALGYDSMIPNDDEIKEIIRLSWDCQIGLDPVLSDPRYGLAAACVNWKPELTHDFLKHCLESDDMPLKYIAEKSLNGKKVKLR